MSLPPPGWYPDPYRTPGLLRWWDGASWTQHTHWDQARGQDETAVQAPVDATTVQPTTGQPAALPATAQTPAITSGPQTSGTGGMGPDGASGTQVLFVGDTWQTGEPGYAPSGGPGESGLTGTYGAFGLFGGVMGSRTGGPGGPGGPFGPGAPVGPGDRYGYLRAQRRRRMWMAGGLAAGTAVAVGLIALIVANLSSSPATTAADHASVKPKATRTAAAPSPTASPAATASPGAPGSVLSDAQTGLSYPQLAAPWQAGCPGGLNNGSFTFTGGESAVAGQVNNGQTTWYGEACSGPLPAQYGYTGVADLATVATNLANTFQGQYYNVLQHTAAPQLSEPVQVGGHAGWEVKYLVTYTDAAAQQVTWADEDAAVVVVDTGTGNVPVVFFTSVPANLGEPNVDSLVSALNLAVVPAASTSPPPTPPSPPPTSPPGDGQDGSSPGGNNP